MFRRTESDNIEDRDDNKGDGTLRHETSIDGIEYLVPEICHVMFTNKQYCQL
jgi:hypothetical protein